MTHRESEASSGVAAAAHKAVADPAPPRPGEPGPLPRWEDLYLSAPPEQRDRLLSLARRQGVLYPHQLPRTVPTAATADAGQRLLTQLLGGQPPALQPLRTTPVEVHDTALDAAQREAVARAVQTPDLFLLQGLPGTGKSRVAAEIVTQAAARGERVLLLAPTAAAIDQVLERVAARDVVCPVRCLERDEAPESLPPTVRALTFAERARRLTEAAQHGARAEVAAAEQHLLRLRQDEPRWARLEELAAAQQVLDRQREALRARADNLAADVEQEGRAAESGEGTPSPFVTRLRDCRRTHAEALARIDHSLAGFRQAEEQARQECTDLASRADALRPLAEAKLHGSKLTAAWWRATLRGNTLAQWEELQARLGEATARLGAAEQQTQALTTEREQAQAAHEQECGRLIAEEVARRRAELDDQETALAPEERLLRTKWDGACQELDAAVRRPTGRNVAAVAEAREGWRTLTAEQTQRLAFAREWAAHLEAAGDELARRLPHYVNLVAATTSALPSDPRFGDASANGSPHPRPFDLLVLEEAERVTESEFLRLARRARRWVLIGEPAREPAAGATPPHAGPRPRGPRTGPGFTLRPGLFHRLWQVLHCDPRQSPCAWIQEGGRLVCRLRPYPPEQAGWVERERVADFPEIELRILTPPRGEPTLVEVHFPPSMAVQQAKEYIFRELGELPVRGTGHSLQWFEEPDRVTLRLGARQAAHAAAAVLQPGVREMVAAADAVTNGAPATETSWQTCCIEFDRQAGWHGERARAWAEQHLPLRDLGRTVRLDVPYRMRPSLAACLSEWLFHGGYAANAEDGPGDVPVEFIAVPPQAVREGGKGKRRERAAAGGAAGAAVAVAPARGGAGLELDLADLRHRDRLPSELRPRLPDRGLVNYLEAQAVVRTAQELLRDAPAPVTVLALYPAQAELIRLLLRERLAGDGREADVEVATPATFRHREADTILLSLTRSHAYRAVAFGEGPHDLALALTRARSRLILFGDWGTLLRRGQWHGALDHHDETAAARERALVEHLVQHLEGHGGRPGMFRLREGNGS